jgi:uncharacterized membrane protein YczE
VALGVGISIKSNLGIAPPSCPPTILNLRWTDISVGTFTWMMHLVFIAIQALILRKRFRLRFLMQIPAAFVFGYMCDAAIWLFDAISNPATNYLVQILLSLASVVLTAIGIKLEVVGNGWILAGDKIVAVLADVLRKPFSTMKIFVDVALVVMTAAFAWVSFGLLTGNGITVVIREGTLILALLTGICMHFTDRYVERFFGPLVPRDE